MAKGKMKINSSSLDYKRIEEQQSAHLMIITNIKLLFDLRIPEMLANTADKFKPHKN